MDYLVVQKDPQIRAVIEQLLQELKQSAPRNTERAYQPKQKEWSDWCAEKWPDVPPDWPPVGPWLPDEPLPGDLVDEGKLLFFMQSQVLCRAPKRGRRAGKQKAAAKAAKKRKLSPAGEIVVGIRPVPELVSDREDDDDDGDGNDNDNSNNNDDDDKDVGKTRLQLQYNTVRGYLSAIRKLYEWQKSSGVNPAPRPDGVMFKALLKSILSTKAFKRRKEYADRGAGTIKDSYLPSQIPDHTAAVWLERKEVACALRTQVSLSIRESESRSAIRPLVTNWFSRSTSYLATTCYSGIVTVGQWSFLTYSALIFQKKGTTRAPLRHSLS
jgi:hypothetical protein